MNDPYVVLGVSPSATDDEVKKAYREMARKYHPDTYQNNPLADLAEEKMKEVNDAYENITRMRKAGQSNNRSNSGQYQQQSYSSGQQQSYSSQGTIYQQIRAMIQAGNMMGAEQLLQQNPSGDAEWHFLMGMVLHRKGWLDEARQHFSIACQLAPQNREYQQALYTMGQNNQYKSNVSPCCCCCPCDGDCCTTLLCLNCLCGDGCCC